jgi:hypothetical protein
VAVQPLPSVAQPTVDEAPGVVASIERIDAWLSIATPGSEFLYATRATLPPGCKPAAYLRTLAAAGEIDLFQRCCAGGGLKNYVARRKAPEQKPEAPASSTRAERPERADDVLAMLRTVARRGLPCPTDAAIARHLNLRRPSEAAALLSDLADVGEILLERVSRPYQRVVTIVATGKRTASL